MSDIRTWSTSAGSNQGTATGGMTEGQAPSTVNDQVRVQMAAHRTQWEDAEWFDWGHVPAYVSASTFTVSNSVTLVYAIGRRLKLGGIGSDYLYGHVTSISAVSATNTKFTVSLTSGNLTSSLSTVAVSILDPTNTSLPKGATLDTPTLTTPTLTAAVLNTSVAGTAVAGQSDMETPSSTAIIVTPARVQYHPGVAKAWVVFDGTSGSPSAAAGHNITSITKNGTGDYTITFTTAFSSANYAAIVTAGQGSTGTGGFIVSAPQTSNPTTTTYRIQTNSNVTTPADAKYVQAVFFGDQ
jgi:hypothetical protein